MKNILMLGTGGTIASEMTPDGLTPELRPAQLLKYVPAIKALCNVDCLSLFNIDSTNIPPRHWCAMAAALREACASHAELLTVPGAGHGMSCYTDPAAYEKALDDFCRQVL